MPPIFKNSKLNTMKKLILITVMAALLASCTTQRYCQPSKRSRDYAGEVMKTKDI